MRYKKKGAHPTGLTRKGVMALITKTIINITKNQLILVRYS